MLPPIERLKKQDIVWLKDNCCKAHRKTYLEHYNCYLKEVGIKERIGFLDIESSNLKANFGFVFSYVIKSNDGEYYKRLVTTQEIRSNTFDKNLLRQFIVDVRNFDRIVTYYGSRFDLPFLRTRCEYWHLDFPIFNEIKQTDLYEIIKYRFKFTRSSLGVACGFFNIAAKTHPMNTEQWMKANAGDKKALKFIMTHNIEDVDSTEALYKRVMKYSKKKNTSL